MTGSNMTYDLIIWSWCNSIIINVFNTYQGQRYSLSMNRGNNGTYISSWRTTINSLIGVPLETIRQQIYDYQ